MERGPGLHLRRAGDYDITTSKTDTSCVNPFSGKADYIDLLGVSNGAIKAQPAVSGDSKLWKAFGDKDLGLYGELTRDVGFTDDGFLVYGGADNWAQSEDDEPYTPQLLPNPALPNNIAAGMWRDGQVFYDAAANSGVSVAQTSLNTAGDAGMKIIEWDNLGGWRAPGDSLDMEVFMFAGSNDLVWVYDDIKADLSEVTVGTENADGTNGQALVNKADVGTKITNGTVVCMTYESALGDPVSFTYQVTVDGDVHERQRLVNEAVHTTSDPGAKPASVTNTVVVKGASERSEVALSINPNRIETVRRPRPRPRSSARARRSRRDRSSSGRAPAWPAPPPSTPPARPRPR